MTEDKKQKPDEIFSESEGEKRQEPKTFKDRFMYLYYNAVPYFNINLAWFVMSFPVVTVFPAMGGLYYAMLSLVKENRADWGTVWEGFKKHWWLSLRWGFLVFFGDLILIANIWFYFTLTQQWAIFALVACSFLLVFWIAINQFSFPLLLLQEEKKIFLAIRNGYVIVMRKPLEALKVMALNLLITIVSVLMPPLWIFISLSLIIYIQTRSVLKMVDKIRVQDAERAAAEAHRKAAEAVEDSEQSQEDEGDSYPGEGS
jgi:uncharacterized membrane protein YesL